MRWLIGTWFWLVLKQCSGQPAVKPDTVCLLPPIVNESSGLWVAHPALFWTHNDSGDGPFLYAFDSTGSLVQQVALPGASNVDWEGLAYDPAGRLFIGDFGNNNQQRTDLRVYIQTWPPDSILPAPGVLHFTYPDQTAFPAQANFDMEGFFFWLDSLYLFSKNKITNTSGYSKMYRLPADTGTFVAELMDSIETGSPVTSADISPSGQRMVLLCYGKFVLFETGGTMDHRQWQRRDFGIPLSQTEAIAFWGEDTLYMTDEQGRLYRIDLTKLPIGRKDRDTGRGMLLYPNPAESYAWLEIPELPAGKCTLRIWSANGRLVRELALDHTLSMLTLQGLATGYYILEVSGADESWHLPVSIIQQ